MHTRNQQFRRAALAVLILIILLSGIGLTWLIRREATLEGNLLLSLDENGLRSWHMLDVATHKVQGWRMDVDPTIPTGSTNMRISADGQQIAFAVFDSPTDTSRIYVVNLNGSNLRALTSGEGRDHTASWSPDSSQIVFSRTRRFVSALFVVDVATGVERQVTEFTNDIEADWSPDGSRIVFTTSRDGFQELYTYTLATGALKRLTSNELQNDLEAQFSPDGRYITVLHP